MQHQIGADYTQILRSRLTKRGLPFVGRLKIKFPIEELQREISGLLSAARNNTIQAFGMDPASSEHNYHLKNTKGESFIKNYDEFYAQYSAIGFQELTPEARALANRLPFKVTDLTPRQRLRGMCDTNYEFYHPHYDERNYTTPTHFQTPLIAKVLGSFLDQACRSALVVLKPGQFISPHFDIGPEFVSRLHIPIFTNPDARFGILGNNGWEEYYFPSDGHAYFVNSGWEHYAINLGQEPRFQIRICLNGQQDLMGMENLDPVRVLTPEEFESHPCAPQFATSGNILKQTLNEFNMDKSGKAKLT